MSFTVLSRHPKTEVSAFFSKRGTAFVCFGRIKQMVSLFVVLVLLSCPLLQATLSQGQNFGREMMNKSGNVATSVNPTTIVPQYTNNPQEAALTEGTLTGQTSAAFASNKAAQLVKTSEENRGTFSHLDQNPLLTFSKELTKNPLELLSRFYQNCREVPLKGGPPVQEKEQVTCEEAGESYTLSCTQELDVTVTSQPSIPHTFQFNLAHLWDNHRAFWQRYFQLKPGRHANRGLDFGGYNKGGDASYARHYTYVPHPARDTQFLNELFALTGRIDARHQAQLFTRLFRQGQRAEDPVRFEEAVETLKLKQVIALPGFGHKSYSGQHFYLYSRAQVDLEKKVPPIITEAWVSTCDLLEEKVDSGLCQYAREVCSQGPQTRMINGHAVFRECWQKTYTYTCQIPAKDDCEPLRRRGCHQLNSRCKQQIGRSCVLYDQTYQCLKPLAGEGQGAKAKIVCGKAPLCLSGDCVDQRYPFNSEMGEALSHLSVLREIQNQVKNGLPQIFKGSDERCSRNIASFKDCCGKGSGWGRDLGLASCMEAEKLLCKKRQKRQCHRIGTYCSKRVLGVCVEKKNTFCCFGSGFMRSIQEQGRTQIGLSWGEPESPVCRGFTVGELSRIDFSRMNLQEILGEILGNYKQPTGQALGHTIGRRMGEIQESLKNDPKLPQRAGGG